MLDLKFIRENTDAVRKAIQEKNVQLDLDLLLSLDQKALELKKTLQELQEQRNHNAKAIPKASAEERPTLIEKGREIGQKITDFKPKQQDAEERLKALLLLVPQIPSEQAPRGASADENVVVKTWGEKPQFDFKPLDHVDLLKKNNWSDLERVAKVAGSRSYCLKGEAVILEMAILRFAVDHLMARGFTPVSVPSFADEEAFVGTGHFPTGRDQVYYLEADDKYLTGTSEVTLNSLHRGEILSESELPIRYAGISSCFRREAGSAGKDVRGLIRVHQFHKVEQYIICKNDPKESEAWHQKLLEASEQIVQELKIPYQVVECCTGDMGTGKFRMYDVESWVPSEGKYRETHSCSNLHDWQARRTGIRYRDGNGTVQFCHTLNNTAIATPRFLVSFLENHQNADGTVNVPEKLRPYLGGKKVLGTP